MECEEFILSDWSPPDNPIQFRRPQDDVDADSHHNSHHNHHHIDLHQDDVDARDREPRVQWADEEEEVVGAGMGPAHGGESRRPGTFIIIVGIESCIGICTNQYDL